MSLTLVQLVREIKEYAKATEGEPLLFEAFAENCAVRFQVSAPGQNQIDLYREVKEMYEESDMGARR